MSPVWRVLGFKEAPAVRGGRFEDELFDALDAIGLQRGPCCSRGKIAGGVGEQRRRHVASKRPLLFAGEDAAAFLDDVAFTVASKRPLLFAGEDAPMPMASSKQAAASKRPLLFAGEDAVTLSTSGCTATLQRGPCCSRGKIG